MVNILQTVVPQGGIVTVMGAVIYKLYSDNKAKDDKIIELSEKRVDDLKALNENKDQSAEKISTMVGLIYDKLESKR